MSNPNLNPNPDFSPSTLLSMPKTPGLEFSHPRLYESPSSTVDAKRCLFKYFLTRKCKLAGGVEENPAMTYGKAMHLAFPLALTKSVDDAYEAFCSLWGDDRTVKDWNNIVAMRSIADFREKILSSGLFTLIKPQTIGLGPVPGVKTDDPEPRDCSEWEYEFKLNLGHHVPFMGRIDGLARMTHDNSLWVVEYKTTTKLGGNYFFDAFQLSPQILSYVLATRLLVPNEKVGGAIVIASRVSSANSETIPQPIHVRDHQIENHIHWLREMFRRIKRADDEGWYPPDYSGCHPYAQFGSPGYPCEFLAMCRDSEDWTSMRQMYRLREEKLVSPTIGGKALESLNLSQTLVNKEIPCP